MVPILCGISMGLHYFNVGGIPTLTTFFTDVVGNNNLGIATDTG